MTGTYTAEGVGYRHLEKNPSGRISHLKIIYYTCAVFLKRKKKTLWNIKLHTDRIFICDNSVSLQPELEKQLTILIIFKKILAHPILSSPDG